MHLFLTTYSRVAPAPMTNDEQDAALLRLEMAAETAATVLAVVGRIWDQKYLQIRRDQGLDLGFRALGE